MAAKKKPSKKKAPARRLAPKKAERKPAARRARVSPAMLVPGFIAKFDPVIQRIARLGRAMLRQHFPTAVEAVYEGGQALAIGYGPTDRAADFVVSLAIHPGGVNLYFGDGARLPDPKRVLEGAGKGRFVRLRTVADLESPAVTTLLATAAKRARGALPAGGRGRTVVSIGARQEPERRRSRSGSLTVVRSTPMPIRRKAP